MCVEEFLRLFITALSNLNLYSKSHEGFLKPASKAFSILNELLAGKNEIAVGIINSTFVFENETMPELSEKLMPLIEIFEKKGIERIIFYRGFSESEFKNFIYFFSPKNEIDDIDQFFSEYKIANILIGDIRQNDEGGESEGASLFISDNELVKLCESSIDMVSSGIDDILDGKQCRAGDLKSMITSLMVNMLGRHNEFLKLGAAKRYDIVTFVHLIKVSILAMHLAAKLGFNRDVVQDVGIAGIFHDIGKIYISRKILKKPSRLTEEEFKSIAMHTQIGAEIMLDYTDKLGYLPVVVAYEHHVKENGLGYPNLIGSHKQHIVSKIVAICDVYDALAERRSYKDNFSPDVIYRIMMNGRGEHFNAELLDKFFSIVGIWPVGTIVELANGSVAVVRDVNERFIDKPVVELVEKKGVFLDLSLPENEEYRILKSLNPYEEGKKYIEYI